MFALYVGGIFSAMAVAAVLKLWRGTVRPTPLIMELPPYRLPALRSLAQGLYERASIFIKRVGGHHPGPVGAAVGAVHLSGAARGRPLNQPSTTAWRASWAVRWSRCFAPLGFNWQNCHCAGARHGGARGGGQCAGHGVCAVGHGRRGGGANWAR
jgi:ferrous iron transport protein B